MTTDILDLLERNLILQIGLQMEHQQGAFDSKTSGGKPESRPPRGADPDREVDEWGGPVDPETDLHGWFHWRRGMAGDDRDARKRLVLQAQVRLEERLQGSERTAGSTDQWKSSTEIVKARDKRIVEEYVGLAPEKVAWIEGQAGGLVPATNVIRVREAAGLDGRTGHPRDEVSTWSNSAKREEARRLRKAGLTLGQIADRLDKSRSTVQGWTKGIVPDHQRDAA